MTANPSPRADGKVPLYTKYITLKDGRRIYASDRGLEAFCIWIDPNKKKK